MNINKFKASLEYLFKAQVTPFIWGHAGIGKSSIIKQYAVEKGYHFFPLYLGTQSDLGDILGLADFVRDESGTALATKFATPEWLRNTIDYCNANPESGAIIFLDEFNRARRDIISGMFSLALDKTFHTIKLPANCYIVAAGNPPTDEYFTTDIDDTALMARFVHVKLEPSFQEWLDYAKAKEIESSLVEFLREQPALLEDSRSSFELPIKVDRRAFERLDKLFKVKTPTDLLIDLMPGIVGMPRTVAYLKYLENADKPLSGFDILSGKNFDKLVKWSDFSNVQSSLLNLTCDNVKEVFSKLKEPLKDKEANNLMSFLSVVPKDISYNMIKSLVETDNGIFKDFYSRKEFENKIVDLLRQAKGKKNE